MVCRIDIGAFHNGIRLSNPIIIGSIPCVGSLYFFIFFIFYFYFVVTIIFIFFCLFQAGGMAWPSASAATPFSQWRTLRCGMESSLKWASSAKSQPQLMHTVKTKCSSNFTLQYGENEEKKTYFCRLISFYTPRRIVLTFETENVNKEGWSKIPLLKTVSQMWIWVYEHMLFMIPFHWNKAEKLRVSGPLLDNPLFCQALLDTLTSTKSPYTCLSSLTLK